MSLYSSFEESRIQTNSESEKDLGLPKHGVSLKGQDTSEKPGSFFISERWSVPLLATKQEGLIRKFRYLDVATRAFSSKPRGEEAGRVEVMLKVAYHLSGGDGNGLVDCYRSMCKK